MSKFVDVEFSDKLVGDFKIPVEDGTVHFTTYKNGDPAIEIVDNSTGQLVAVPTVNLDEYGIHPDVGNVIVKEYSSGAGMTDFLQQVGAVGFPVKRYYFGPFDASAVEVPVISLTNEGTEES